MSKFKRRIAQVLVAATAVGGLSLASTATAGADQGYPCARGVVQGAINSKQIVDQYWMGHVAVVVYQHQGQYVAVLTNSMLRVESLCSKTKPERPASATDTYQRRTSGGGGGGARSGLGTGGGFIGSSGTYWFVNPTVTVGELQNA